MDARLTDVLGKSALTRSGKSIPERRDLGELTHIFSHVKHHMGIEHLHFESEPELQSPADELRWMTVAEMHKLGITTGVKKILQLVLHPEKGNKRAATKAKSKSSATSTASHVTHGGEKRDETITHQNRRREQFELAKMDDAVEGLAPRAVALEIDHDVAVAKAAATPERVIYFRDLGSWDIPQVRQLHEEWFPIRYNQAFYDGAAQGLWMETGGPLFARLAVEMQPSADVLQPRPEDRQDEHILGAVTASTLPLSKVDDPDLIAADDWEHSHIMYILTLGTRSSVRRMGTASALLQECIAQACRQPQCGAVYLHVKADNLSARHFYEKNGFQNLRPLFALFSIASFGWKKLIEGFTVEEFEDTTAEKLARSPASAPVESANIVPSGQGAPVVDVPLAFRNLVLTSSWLLIKQGKNELDDLLDMLGDEDSKPAAVHPRPMSSSRAGAYNSSGTKSSRNEFQAGGTKK
ncbi:unnamed protein product [Phytophthora lilii]|uniref:N-alpha-acetyltransferase 60 n=1 Tax=Phytophthora lilii TaxID=2077276 RepID=A0A9W6YKT6_9STRA|nr:unnamed protein product [Phytophthora lilii]